MTLPSLIQNYKEKEYTAKLKKFNSLINQAMMMATTQEGPIEDWGLTRFSSSEGMTDEHSSHILNPILYWLMVQILQE